MLDISNKNYIDLTGDRHKTYADFMHDDYLDHKQRYRAVQRKAHPVVAMYDDILDDHLDSLHNAYQDVVYSIQNYIDTVQEAHTLLDKITKRINGELPPLPETAATPTQHIQWIMKEKKGDESC